MRKLSPEQWERRYITGKVERFDQKHTMFNRPAWDPRIHSGVDSWAIRGTIRDKPGYHLEEWALNWASRRGTLFGLFNTSKPASGRAAKALARAMPVAKDGSTALGIKAPENAAIRDTSTQGLTRKIKKAAVWFGADMVGVCRVDDRWVYSHVYDHMSYGGKGSDVLESSETVPQEIPEEFRWAVVMCFEESYDLLSYYPTLVSNVATSMGYSRMAITNHYLSAFIRNMGFDAIDCTTNDVALSIPMAMQAGLGDLGRNGLLITPRYGPRVRISKVLTNLPLVPDQPLEFGVTEFCEACEICAENCPSRSILQGPRTSDPRNASNLANVLRWPVDAETCRMFWGRKNQGCTTCIACCPYNKPDTLFHAAVRWFTDHARWGDTFYVAMDKLLGYGKPKKAGRFWDEWKPERKS